MQARGLGAKPLAPLNGATVRCHPRPPAPASVQYGRSWGGDFSPVLSFLRAGRCRRRLDAAVHGAGFAPGHTGGPLGLKCLPSAGTGAETA